MAAAAASSFCNINVVFCRKTWMTVMILGLFLGLTINFQQVEAGRPLGIEEARLKLNQNLIIQSLPRGSPTIPSPNPCTHIPGSTTGRCTLETENQADGGASGHFHAVNAPAPFTVQFGVAVPRENVAPDHHDQDQDRLKKDHSTSS